MPSPAWSNGLEHVTVDYSTPESRGREFCDSMESVYAGIRGLIARYRALIADAERTGRGDPIEVFRALRGDGCEGVGYPERIPVYAEASDYRWSHPQSAADLEYALAMHRRQWARWYGGTPKAAEWVAHESRFRWAMSLIPD